MLEWHPILHRKQHEVFGAVFETGLDVHPCYYGQGMTREMMLEMRRTTSVRMSCRCCIFKTEDEIELVARLDYNHALFDELETIEAKTGHLFRQGMGIADIRAGKHLKKRTIYLQTAFNVA